MKSGQSITACSGLLQLHTAEAIRQAGKTIPYNPQLYTVHFSVPLLLREKYLQIKSCHVELYSTDCFKPCQESKYNEMQECSTSSWTSHISLIQNYWHGRVFSAVLKAVIISFQKVNIPLKKNQLVRILIQPSQPKQTDSCSCSFTSQQQLMQPKSYMEFHLHWLVKIANIHKCSQGNKGEKKTAEISKINLRTNFPFSKEQLLHGNLKNTFSEVCH